MDPFTVMSFSVAPPVPMVPRRCRGLILPVIFTGKSVSTRPFTVSASMLALIRTGKPALTEPLTVVSRTSPLVSDCMFASMLPLTVVA